MIEQTEKNIILSGVDKENDPLTYIITVLPIKGVLKDDSVIISVNDLPKTINNSKLSYSSLSDNDLVDTFKFKVNGFSTKIGL